MSDTNLSAPAPADAPAAPAPAGEVPVNPSPVAPPQSIGSQAPEAPVDLDKHKGSEHRPPSRHETTREAIAKAFKRAEAPGPAKAKMGHNQPPEPMEREAPKEKLDLKKRPADERPRGEHGHFAPAAKTAATDASSATAASEGTGQQGQAQAGTAPGQPAPSNVVQLPDGAPYREAPKRFRDRARAEWAAAPESVRGEVHRMHDEFARAYEVMAPDHQEMNTIRRFHQLAQQHGTTLERALTNYTSMEDKLRADPVAGLDVIVNNLNLRTPNGERIGLRDIAWHILNQTPDQHQATQLKNSQTAISQQMQQLQQQQNAIAQATAALQYERQAIHTRGEVDRFAETHPRLDELGDLIQAEINLGFDLPEAYRRADLLKPASATQAAQTRAPTAQTRSTDKSIHGAPDRSISNGHDERPANPSKSARDSITRAMRVVSGSL